MSGSQSLRETIAASLPGNYNFEIEKSVAKITECKARKVALQMPEGLLLYAATISDIIGCFTGAECVIMADVTFGACCIDDLGAVSIGCDFLIHYGHSCLVPIDQTSPKIKMLYVFVDIAFDTSHLLSVITANFSHGSRLALASTIQFSPALFLLKRKLEEDLGFSSVLIPQAKPLSPGETLGCTSPRLPEGSVDAVIFIADGRFHLESMMIQNAWLEEAARRDGDADTTSGSISASVKRGFFRYDPYGKVMTREQYATEEMRGIRYSAIELARAAIQPSAKSGRSVGIVLGTLGRQGSPAILSRLEAAMRSQGIPYVVLLLSELSPQKLAQMEAPDDERPESVVGPMESNFFSGYQDFPASLQEETAKVCCWVQIACPRLSIDWGYAFSKPVLTPYEADVALGKALWEGTYPMDYYAKGSGAWTNFYKAAEENGGGRKSVAKDQSGGEISRQAKLAAVAARKAAAGK